MMMRQIYESILSSFYPVVCRNFATRITEPALAGIGTVVAVTAFATLIQTVSELVFVSTSKDFLYVFFYRISNTMYTFKSFPIILKYLLECIFTCYLFKH